MLIGVISDTHNDVETIRKAVNLFNLRGCDMVLHCGDIFSPSAAQEFSKLQCGFKAVFGNNDFDRAGLENVISDFGIIRPAPFEFKISNKLFVMSHKLENIYLSANEKKYDYILYGHLHKPRIEKRNYVPDNAQGNAQSKTLLLNPGEACGYRYGAKTAALIDLILDSAEIVDLDF